jgi:hypothetical protein
LCSTAICIVDRLLFVRPIHQPLAPKDGKPSPVPYRSFPELGADIVPEQMISKMILIACSPPHRLAAALGVERPYGPLAHGGNSR